MTRPIKQFPDDMDLKLLSKAKLLGAFSCPVFEKSNIRLADTITNTISSQRTVSFPTEYYQANGAAKVLQDSIVELARDIDVELVGFLYEKAIKLSKEDQIINNCLLKMNTKDALTFFFNTIYSDIYPDILDRTKSLITHILRKGYEETTFSATGALNESLPEFIMWVDDPPLRMLLTEDIKVNKISEDTQVLSLNYQLQTTRRPIIILERSRNASNI